METKAANSLGRPRIEIPKEDIVHMYYEEKRSLVEIAIKYECDPATVRNRMKEYGLERRYRGSGEYGSPKKQLCYVKSCGKKQKPGSHFCSAACRNWFAENVALNQAQPFCEDCGEYWRDGLLTCACSEGEN